MENQLRRRLEMLKERARARSGLSGRASPPPEIDSPCSLVEAAAGTVHGVESERFYLVRFRDGDIAADAPHLCARYLRIPQRDTWPLSALLYDPGPAMAGRIAEGGVCFLDIETTGLTPSTYLFLCGLMFVEDGGFVVEQLFARDYSEEAGVLLYLRDMIKRFPMLVTYNGAGFDIPFVQTRMTVARVPDVRPAEHVDLLAAAQVHFENLLPDCRLETVERHLRGFGREGDIPGREIPDAYHEFVRTENAAKIKRILYHNRMDLLAMAYLVNHLAGVP